MRFSIRIGIGLVGVGLMFLSACTQQADTPSRGEITITADESLQPVVDILTSAYEGINPKTKFHTLYQPEEKAIATMLRDSARLVFSTRELNEREVAVLKRDKIEIRTQFIATDGIALIASQINKDSLFTMAELDGIFKGEITRWEQLPGGSLTGPIILVFDNNNSSNLTYMLKRFNVTDFSKLKIFTVNSNKKVIEYVRKNPIALGFIGVNWISDGDVPLTEELSKDIRVMGVSDKKNPTSIKDYYQPFQRNLGLELYPLRRKVYILSREVYSGLGGGLMTYIARDVGNLLIEKSGLWPSEPYNREIYLEKK